MAALHYCMVEWPGHHKLASAGSDLAVHVFQFHVNPLPAHPLYRALVGQQNNYLK